MKKYFPITIIFILLSTASFLFWKGEVSMEKASQDFTLFYFENTQLETTDSPEDLKKTLAFSIENNKQKDISYEITYFLNNQEIEKTPIEIKANETKKIIPSENLISKARELNDDFVYGIKTNQTKKGFELNKKVTIVH